MNSQIESDQAFFQHQRDKLRQLWQSLGSPDLRYDDPSFLSQIYDQTNKLINDLTNHFTNYYTVNGFTYSPADRAFRNLHNALHQVCEDVKNLKAPIARQHIDGITEKLMDAQDALSEFEVAHVSHIKASVTKKEIFEESEILKDDFNYELAQQPWYIGDLLTIQRISHAKVGPEILQRPVLLLTVNDNEFLAIRRLLRPLASYDCVLQVSVRNETYYLGQYGVYHAVLVKTRMGSAGPGATTHVTLHAQDYWKPRATIAVGVAFGMNRKKQKLGDVLIASQIIPYNSIRSGDSITERGQPLASDVTLFNRFDNVYDWQFQRPDGQFCGLHKGTVLSGEELLDNANRKAELMRRFPEAIGGEMEGTGLSAASFYERQPWILIKAICDWADGTGNTYYQPFAAAVAASLVHHVLSDPDSLSED